MKRNTILSIILLLLFSACEKKEEFKTKPEEISSSKKATQVANKGTWLYSKYGCNLNNSYHSKDKSKTDWKRFWTYNADLTTALNKLEAEITNFKIYRVGFSKAMANDPVDLREWTDNLKTVRDHGNKMIICYWPLNGDYSNASDDAAMWQKVVDEMSAQGLLSDIYGWEIINEPMNGGNLGDYYKNVHSGVSNWHGKKILIDGSNWAQHFSQDLVDKTKNIPNSLYAVHCYAKYIGGNSGMTSGWWKNKFIQKWNNDLSRVSGKFIVTELGCNNNYVDNFVGDNQTRERGFVAAAEAYFGGTTTVFWYSAYNSANIGLIHAYNGKQFENNLNALNRIFY